MFLFCILMPGQPPKRMGQSPERGHRQPPVSNAGCQRATKVPIAGAATMLKNGVRGLHRTTIGSSAYTPDIKILRPSPGQRARCQDYVTPASNPPSLFFAENVNVKLSRW
jgi:hypothetical protein